MQANKNNILETSENIMKYIQNNDNIPIYIIKYIDEEFKIDA